MCRWPSCAVARLRSAVIALPSDCGHVAARYPGRLSGLLHRRNDALIACIASNSTRDASSHQLEAFVIHGREKHLIATLRSPEPFGAIALHPSRNVVYAAYDAEEYLGLPGASIMEINPQTGRLGEASRRLFLDSGNLSHGYHHHGRSDRNQRSGLPESAFSD
jgi:hypothetical protein